MIPIKDVTDADDQARRLLTDVGIRTAEQLIERGATAASRMALSDETHLDEEVIRGWVHRADLLRISGIGPGFAQLLCLTGVYTTPKLAYRSTGSLYAELSEMNAKAHIVSMLPSPSELHEMITQAKRLPKLIYH